MKEYYLINPNDLLHSAKGSTWKKHKYIKRIDGSYYYPNSYEGGRHLKGALVEQKKSKKGKLVEEKDSKSSKKSKKSNDPKIDKKDVEALAKEVIQGKYGNGETRKKLLGSNYQKVQDRVNSLLKGKTGSTKVSSISSTTKSGEKAVKKAVQKTTQSSKGLDLNQVFKAYSKKKR